MPGLTKPLSKPKVLLLLISLALILFFAVGFLAGKYYGEMLALRGPIVAPTPTPEKPLITQPDQGYVACTQEVKLCPDGAYVSRTGPNCEFASCPGSD